MTIKKLLITTYYLTITTILVSQVISTVFELSQSIGYGQKISELSSQKESLEFELQETERALAKSQSIYTLESDVDESYIPIASVIQVPDRLVASR